MVAVLLKSFALSSTGLVIIWLVWGVLFLHTIWKVASWSVGYLVVTPGRIFSVVGLVYRKVSAMPLSAITDLRLRRPLSGSVFGYGDLIVESKSSDQPLTVLDHIPFPEEVYLLMRLGPDPPDPLKDFVSRYLQGRRCLTPFKIVRLLERTSRNEVHGFTCSSPRTALQYSRRSTG